MLNVFDISKQLDTTFNVTGGFVGSIFGDRDQVFDHIFTPDHNFNMQTYLSFQKIFLGVVTN